MPNSLMSKRDWPARAMVRSSTGVDRHLILVAPGHAPEGDIATHQVGAVGAGALQVAQYAVDGRIATGVDAPLHLPILHPVPRGQAVDGQRQLPAGVAAQVHAAVRSHLQLDVSLQPVGVGVDGMKAGPRLDSRGRALGNDPVASHQATSAVLRYRPMSTRRPVAAHCRSADAGRAISHLPDLEIPGDVGQRLHAPAPAIRARPPASHETNDHLLVPFPAGCTISASSCWHSSTAPSTAAATGGDSPMPFVQAGGLAADHVHPLDATAQPVQGGQHDLGAHAVGVDKPVSPSPGERAPPGSGSMRATVPGASPRARRRPGSGRRSRRAARRRGARRGCRSRPPAPRPGAARRPAGWRPRRRTRHRSNRCCRCPPPARRRRQGRLIGARPDPRAARPRRGGRTGTGPASPAPPRPGRRRR